MPWIPTEVAYGVRHNRLFGVLRTAGDAIDKVVALQGTGNVPRKCLTRIGWPEPVTAMLVDDDENYRLTYNIDGGRLVEHDITGRRRQDGRTTGVGGQSSREHRLPALLCARSGVFRSTRPRTLRQFLPSGRIATAESARRLGSQGGRFRPQ